MDNKEIASTLYHAYVKMYGRKPILDGTSNDLTIEFQAMAYLLKQYGVVFVEGSFTLDDYKHAGMPMSIKIQNILDSYILGHNDSEFQEEVAFNKHASRVLDILGEVMKNFSSINQLRMLVHLYFTKESLMPSAGDAELLTYTGATESDLKRYKDFLAHVLYKLTIDNYNQVNIDSIIRATEEGEVPDKSYRPILNEAGSGKPPVISEKSRKIVAETLLR